jgi:uncharacterized protein (DUF362 family)
MSNHNNCRSKEAGIVKTEMNRRKFLRLTANGLGSLLLARFLSACQRVSGGTAANGSSPAASSPTPSIAITDTPEALLPTETAAPPEPAYLAIAHGDVEPEALVRSAVDAVGGMSRFVPAGAKVVIKPNICVGDRSYEYAATTNPWVVGELVRMCREANAGSVLVLDYPFYKSSKEAYLKSGIREQVEAAGGEMSLTSTYYLGDGDSYIYVDYDNWIDKSLPNAQKLKSFQIIDEVLKADVLINVPIAKTHDTTRLTLGMKNLMGVVHNRPDMHPGIHDKITDLAVFLRPALTVIDAVRILTANGPHGGSLNDVQKTDTVIASPDIVAADSYATSLFGLTPSDIGYILKGEAAGLGTSNPTPSQIQKIELGG